MFLKHTVNFLTFFSLYNIQVSLQGKTTLYLEATTLKQIVTVKAQTQQNDTCTTWEDASVCATKNTRDCINGTGLPKDCFAVDALFKTWPKCQDGFIVNHVPFSGFDSLEIHYCALDGVLSNGQNVLDSIGTLMPKIKELREKNVNILDLTNKATDIISNIKKDFRQEEIEKLKNEASEFASTLKNIRIYITNYESLDMTKKNHLINSLGKLIGQIEKKLSEMDKTLTSTLQKNNAVINIINNNKSLVTIPENITQSITLYNEAITLANDIQKKIDNLKQERMKLSNEAIYNHETIFSKNVDKLVEAFTNNLSIVNSPIYDTKEKLSKYHSQTNEMILLFKKVAEMQNVLKDADKQTSMCNYDFAIIKSKYALITTKTPQTQPPKEASSGKVTPPESKPIQDDTLNTTFKTRAKPVQNSTVLQPKNVENLVRSQVVETEVKLPVVNAETTLSSREEPKEKATNVTKPEETDSQLAEPKDNTDNNAAREATQNESDNSASTEVAEQKSVSEAVTEQAVTEEEAVPEEIVSEEDAPEKTVTDKADTEHTVPEEANLKLPDVEATEEESSGNKDKNDTEDEDENGEGEDENGEGEGEGKDAEGIGTEEEDLNTPIVEATEEESSGNKDKNDTEDEDENGEGEGEGKDAEGIGTEEEDLNTPIVEATEEESSGNEDGDEGEVAESIDTLEEGVKDDEDTNTLNIDTTKDNNTNAKNDDLEEPVDTEKDINKHHENTIISEHSQLANEMPVKNEAKSSSDASVNLRAEDKFNHAHVLAMHISDEANAEGQNIINSHKSPEEETVDGNVVNNNDLFASEFSEDEPTLINSVNRAKSVKTAGLFSPNEGGSNSLIISIISACSVLILVAIGTYIFYINKKKVIKPDLYDEEQDFLGGEPIKNDAKEFMSIHLEDEFWSEETAINANS